MAIGLYCYRCDRQFGDHRALRQHLDKSWSHWECEECSFDGTTRDELFQHYDNTEHRVVCRECSCVWVPDSDSYFAHLRDKNVCTTCMRHFTSQNSLQYHRITHRPLAISCYGCTRKFKTYSGMIIHLEYGICNQAFDREILNRAAAQCYQWKHFVAAEYRCSMLEQVDLIEEYSNTIYPFMCPSCDTPFTKLSGMFQHAESDTCNASLSSGSLGKLVRWFEKLYE